ncbi:MAG: hypothetical protein IIW70_06295 [Bacteroidales bacterium]|nr:hypothetical protein [Bacteroidales bacterium]
MGFPIGVGNDYCCVVGKTAIVWSGMTAVLMAGAEITMHLSLGMRLSMDEILLEGKVQVLLCVFL